MAETSPWGKEGRAQGLDFCGLEATACWRLGFFHPGSESGIKLMTTLAAGMPGFTDSLVHISYPNDSLPVLLN